VDKTGAIVPYVYWAYGYAIPVPITHAAIIYIHKYHDIDSDNCRQCSLVVVCLLEAGYNNILLIQPPCDVHQNFHLILKQKLYLGMTQES